MTREDLRRCELELEPLVPLDGASTFARESATLFNADASDVRAAVLEPIRGLVDRGAAPADLTACLERSVAELAFWRRVLVRFHEGAFREGETGSDCLVRYLLS